MICPACGNDAGDMVLVQMLDTTILGVCGSCGRSLVVDEDTARVATGADTKTITADQHKLLRSHRRKVLES